jgi:hypothetical protein
MYSKRLTGMAKEVLFSKRDYKRRRFCVANEMMSSLLPPSKIAAPIFKELQAAAAAAAAAASAAGRLIRFSSSASRVWSSLKIALAPVALLGTMANFCNGLVRDLKHHAGSMLLLLSSLQWWWWWNQEQRDTVQLLISFQTALGACEHVDVAVHGQVPSQNQRKLLYT